MKLQTYMLAGLIALGTLAGCGKRECRNLGPGKEVIFPGENTVEAYVDVDSDSQVDLYCKGGVSSLDRKRMAGNIDCLISEGFAETLTEPVLLEVGFGPYSGTRFFVHEGSPTMSAAEEDKFNLEYSALRDTGY